MPADSSRLLLEQPDYSFSTPPEYDIMLPLSALVPGCGMSLFEFFHCMGRLPILVMMAWASCILVVYRRC